MGNDGPVVLEKDLVQTEPVIEGTESGFEALHCIVAASTVEALVVDPAYLQNGAEVTGFGEKCMLVPEAIQIDLRGERACFLPVLRNGVSSEHRASSRISLWRRVS